VRGARTYANSRDSREITPGGLAFSGFDLVGMPGFEDRISLPPAAARCHTRRAEGRREELSKGSGALLGRSGWRRAAAAAQTVAQTVRSLAAQVAPGSIIEAGRPQSTPSLAAGGRLLGLVAFDLYGTVLDISGLAAEMQPVVGDGAAALLSRWRKAQLERSWQANRDDSYMPWDHITLSALQDVAPELPVDDRERLARLWLTVPAFGDAGETLIGLRSVGVRRAILSNGTREMIRLAIEAAGLDVDRILSADDVRAYKTDPRVYALLEKEAGRSRTLFVSSNGWDADGAARAGWNVAWIDRGGDPPVTAPKYRISSLSDVIGLVK
jgi:2-haloacid dehalogenase